MQEDIKWCFAKSKAGHDKTNLYMIVNVENDIVYLSDGKYKTLEKPKKKKRKHIQLINRKDKDFLTKVENHSKIHNEDVKRAIKMYISNMKED